MGLLLDKVPVTMTGSTGGTGYMTFYGPLFSGNMAQLRTFIIALQPYITNDITFNFPTTGYVIDDADGVAKGVWTAGAQGTIQGSDAGGYSLASGGVVNWLTGQLNSRGHKIKGRTFIVPIGASHYGSDGAIAAGVATIIQTAANNLIAQTGQALYVFARPGKTAAGVSYAGTSAKVTSAQFKGKVAVLKSRRD